MRKKVFTYYSKEKIVDVYNAYLSVLEGSPFHFRCQRIGSSIIFSDTMDFKYELHEALCVFSFVSYKEGTAVGITFHLPQLFGGRCQRLIHDVHDRQLGYLFEIPTPQKFDFDIEKC